MSIALTFCPRNYVLCDGAPIEIAIGLEVHTQLSSVYKLFSGRLDALTTLDVGLPGSLPVINLDDICGVCALAGLLSAKICRWLSFTRKGYFCADLALGYQITQCYNPLLLYGVLNVWYINVNSVCSALTAYIQSVNLEHDTGSTSSLNGYKVVSFARAGASLLEFVSFPCFDSALFVRLFLLKLKLILTCFYVSSCVMADAEMRYDFNISVSEPLGARSARTEIKNLNSVSGLGHIVLSEACLARRVYKSCTKAVEFKTFTTFFLRKKESAREYKRLFEADVPFTLMLAGALAIKQRTLRLHKRALWIVSCGLFSFLQVFDIECLCYQVYAFSRFGFKLLGCLLKERPLWF
ncbi:MAG: hypothetical protein AAJB65_00530 [Candidatus Hodgkinia cicadicola]